MHSYRVNVENPWNLFAVDDTLPKTPSLNIYTNASFTNSTQNFEKFLSNKVPVSFSGKQNVICCKICKVLVVKNRYKEHYDNRHNLCNSKTNMIPYEDDILLNDKTYKTKKIKRSKKKRPNIKEKLECSSELLNKKKSKKIKVKSANKRLHSKALFDDMDYVNKKKKLKCEFLDTMLDNKHFTVRNEEDFLSSPKQLDDNFYPEKIILNKSYNPLSINDGLCYSNDSIHRTSSDSSTPPSLSLGTLQTLSSPSSLNILNDLSSVITEHYLLPSNDLSTERSGISCKYQIDSLPWENLPPVSNKLHTNGSLFSLKDKESFNEIPLNEEDGEIERAVQSITGFYECLPDEFEITSQISFEVSNDGSKLTVTNNEHLVTEENSLEMKSDMFNADDATVIDCFLDEIHSHSHDKDQLSDNCANSSGTNNQNSVGINQNVVDMFMDDCNNMSEYQIDSNLLNIFNSDYEEKFETLINSTMNEFVTQSPQTISADTTKYDRKKSGGKMIQTRSFDPLKHCGVIGSNGQFCYRSLLCKLHTMPQKRQVERSENITCLIKGIRDCNKMKKLNKKSTQASIDSISSCSKMSCDSFLYNCSSNKSAEEIPSLLENNLSNIDIEGSVLHCTDTSYMQNSTIPNTSEPQPLVVQRFDKEVIINYNRPLLTSKSLVWKNRPKSQCDAELLGRFLSNQNDYTRNYTADIKQAELGFHDVVTGDAFNSQSHSITGAPGKTMSTANSNDFPFDQFCSSYGTTAGFFDMKYSASNNGFDVRDCQISSSSEGQFQPIASLSNLYSESSGLISSANNLSLLNNAKIIPFSRENVTGNTAFLSAADLTLLSNNVYSTASIKNINNLSLQKSPGSFAACTNQLININSQHSNNIDISLPDSIVNNVVSFTDQNSCSSIINTSNQNAPVWNPVLTESVFSNNNKFISITNDRLGAAQMLYPVRNGGQIMMVMNKNQKLISDQTELTNENFSFSVNQQIPINSLLTLKQPNSQMSSQQRNVQQQTTVPTQQIVSISPLELQRLTDGLCGNHNNNNKLLTGECVNKSNESFGNSAKINDKKNQLLYQLNQGQSGGQFISSTLSSKIDSTNLPKPLTVQSSTPNGVTHRFVILPDGTISAFTQQSNSTLKTNLTQPQLINRTAVQHPLFGQLANCGQSQGCFLNGDKLIIAPNQVTSNGMSQQILMPQIINQTDINNQSASRFTLVHQQQKLGAPHKNNNNNNNNNSNNNNNNYNRLSHNNLSANQIPIDSSNQKLSFHIQTPNQYQNHNPNTFFLTTAPSANSNIPLKQQIFLQSNDQITSDFSMIDSSKFAEGQYNAQGKSIHQFENLQCTSDIRTINSSNQDFEFLNQVINPQSIIIQQPPVNRLPNHSLPQLSNTNVVQNTFVSQTSQDINSGIDGAHSNVSNNNNNQHIVINNCSNEQFAQSQLTLSQRQLSTSFSNSSNCNSVVINQNQSNFKTVPPPLVISQQLLNQSVSNQFGNKSFIDIPYQQQSQQKNSHLSQVTLDENQFSNEFVIMQSMIA